jgi:hypothetical protein
MTEASAQIVRKSRRRIARTSRQMRTSDPQTSMSPIPQPGTTEALELGCTCQFIAHDTAIREREPAGMLIEPDPNCPLHGTNRDAGSTRAV